MSVSLTKLAKMISSISLEPTTPPSMKLYISHRKIQSLNKVHKCKEKELWVSVSFTKSNAKRSTIPADAEIIYERISARPYSAVKFFHDNKAYLKHVHGQNFRITNKKLKMLLAVLKTEDEIDHKPACRLDINIDNYIC